MTSDTRTTVHGMMALLHTLEENMSEPTVVCVYFKQELPALANAPIPGELGEQIRTQVSRAGWEAWLRAERAYVTHFELDPRSNEYTNRRQLVIREFFFGPPTDERIVQCIKFGFALPGLVRPPFPGNIGMRIYHEVSQRAWALWPAQERLLINHYGLSLVDPQSQQILMQAMEEFFFGEGSQLPEGWIPPQAPSKGGPRK
jgi:Fe-S cluster biosynthesis and repair protein YggX